MEGEEALEAVEERRLMKRQHAADLQKEDRGARAGRLPRKAM